MGYTGSYSLAARCGSEMLASGFVIWLGESVLANEILGKTKGNGMGYGWVSYGFGLSFFFPLLCFSYISAHVNPATCLFLWVLGELGPGDFFALAASEFAAMFVAACLVWLHFLPHFKTVPEPPPKEPEANFVRSRDVLQRDALNIASFNTMNAARRKQASFTGAFRDVRYFLTPSKYSPEHAETIEHALGLHDPRKLRRTRSVQVADLHEHLKEAAMQQRVRCMRDELVGLYRNSVLAEHASHELPADADEAAEAQEPDAAPETMEKGTAAGLDLDGGRRSSKEDARKRAEERHRAELDRAFHGALLADQNAKLSIFCTRPAIYAPALNWIAEFGGSVILILGARLIDDRGKQMTGELRTLYGTLTPFFIALMIQLIILGMGGPTGVAINPARDLAPRCAHFILPIPNKGSSEWHYAWVPFTAPFCGGLAAAGLYSAINNLNHSSIEAR